MTLQKFINFYEKILKLILFIMMVALAVTVLLGVTFRFAGSALVWYDEVAAVQLAWITYYGSAYAALKGSHISVPSIFKAFPLALRKIFFVKISCLWFFNIISLLRLFSFNSYYWRNFSNLRMGSPTFCAISYSNCIMFIYFIRNFKNS